MNVQVGGEYVLGRIIGAGLAPCQCNSEYNPDHACRVTIASVGRKYAKALVTGYTKPTQVGSGLAVNSNDSGLWEIEVAKASYRAALEAREAKWTAEGVKGLGQKRIDQLVAEL